MAAAIQKKTGVKARLIESSGGVFEVTVDGKKVFSKKESGRFPEPDEILSALAPDNLSGTSAANKMKPRG